MPAAVRERSPYDVERVDTVWIPLSDGICLAATVWRPTTAIAVPVPAILEYIPYRRRDGTLLRDEPMHRYVAGHGYASIRVDLRGSGDSGGILRDEYLPQEQDDAVEVIAWLASQPWCSGAVGMIGISWGGFNALQVAARRPHALKAIVTICSTDDRYADDCHFMGGCLLNNSFAWASTMLAFGAQPPDPEVVGERWRAMWLERVAEAPLMLEAWIAHQTRDAYWRQGSVCEDYGAIEAAVLAVGGWADGYSNAVPRLVESLAAPCLGLIGPWGHEYPQRARPGPAIGFLQETLRWWDHWLKGVDTGVMDEPRYRVYLQGSVPPATTYEERPGRWIGLDRWPRAGNGSERGLFLAPGSLSETAPEPTQRLVSAPLVTGIASGEWCPYGMPGELAQDQRPDDGRSILFDTGPLAAPVAILGAPRLMAVLSSDRPAALLAARLEDVAPDGASTLVTYGLLNLTHHAGHERVVPLEPDRPFRIELRLNDIAHEFPAGHRIRLALAPSHWPMVWPSPAIAGLTLQIGETRLHLPIHDPAREVPAPPLFAAPEEAPSVAHRVISAGGRSRIIAEDATTGEVTVTVQRERTGYEIPETGLAFSAHSTERYRLTEGDPLSACNEVGSEWSIGRGAWRTRTKTWMRLSSTGSNFMIEAGIDAFEGDHPVAERRWTRTVPRRGL